MLAAAPAPDAAVSASTTDSADALDTPAAFGRVGAWALVRRFVRVHWVFFGVAWLWIADALGLRRLVYLLRGRREAYAPITGPVACRIAFEALGPTYVKLGQMIASGDGLFPVRYSEEFRKCLDRVPPFSFADVERTLDEELGRPHAEAFASIEPTPIAAASIAQVHLATLRDGEEVVVKVQRPGLEPVLRADVALMGLYARVLAAIVPHLALANPVGIVEDLAATLAEELDFRREARHMRRFNETLAKANNPGVAAPRVVDALTTRRLLTMERFRGIRVDDTEGIRASRFDGPEKLLAGIRGWFQTLLGAGFFHGDVHAGNFMLLDDGRVGFLDFGIVGHLDGRERAEIIDYVIAFQTRDYDKLADVFIRMGSVEGAAIDRAKFVKDLAAAFAPMVDAGDGFKIRDIMPDMMRVAVRHRMRMPRQFVLVTKQLVYLDRYAKAIGGPKMNVLTDPRVLAFLMEDLAAAGSA